MERNLKVGFATTGIHPFDPDRVLSKLPDHDLESTMSDSLLNFQQSSWKGETRPRNKRQKLNVPAGKSVSEADFRQEEEVSIPVTDDDNKGHDVDMDTISSENVCTNDIHKGD